jgi:hypothetical protein
MPIASQDRLSFSELAWLFKFLPSKHPEIRVWHARPFDNTF